MSLSLLLLLAIFVLVVVPGLRGRRSPSPGWEKRAVIAGTVFAAAAAVVLLVAAI